MKKKKPKEIFVVFFFPNDGNSGLFTFHKKQNYIEVLARLVTKTKYKRKKETKKENKKSLEERNVLYCVRINSQYKQTFEQGETRRSKIKKKKLNFRLHAEYNINEIQRGKKRHRMFCL